jgi:hypothetical protein
MSRREVDVSLIRDEALEELVKDLEEYLKSIKAGQGPQTRMAAFSSSERKASIDLDFNCPMGHFLERQHDLISNTLVVMFGARNEQEVNLIMKVLFPETLIKLYMDFHSIAYELARRRTV